MASLYIFLSRVILTEPSSMSDFINIYSLPKKKTSRERNRLYIYERILRKCHHRIKYTAEHSSSGDMYTFFEIPTIVPGMPIYDILSCTDFLIHKLSSNGFKVLNLGTNLLFIYCGKYFMLICTSKKRKTS